MPLIHHNSSSGLGVPFELQRALVAFSPEHADEEQVDEEYETCHSSQITGHMLESSENSGVTLTEVVSIAANMKVLSIEIRKMIQKLQVEEDSRHLIVDLG